MKTVECFLLYFEMFIREWCYNVTSAYLYPSKCAVFAFKLKYNVELVVFNKVYFNNKTAWFLTFVIQRQWNNDVIYSLFEVDSIYFF